MGKSLLLGLSEKELIEYYRRLSPRKYTPSTLEAIALQRELNEARVTHITRDNAEHEEGVYCIATPVYDSGNRIIGAISISSHDKDLLADPSAREMLLESARLTSRQFGKL